MSKGKWEHSGKNYISTSACTTPASLITYVRHEDGSLLLSKKTVSHGSELAFSLGAIPAGTYTFSLNIAGNTAENLYIGIYSGGAWVVVCNAKNESSSKTITLQEELSNAKFYIWCSGELLFENVNAYARLEEGTSATQLRKVPKGTRIEVWGENHARLTAGRTHNGIIFALNEDGSFTLNGTSTDWAASQIARVTLDAGTYTKIELRNYGIKSIEITAKKAGEAKYYYGTFTLNEPTGVDFYIQVPPNVTADNLVVYPRCFKGSEPLCDIAIPCDLSKGDVYEPARGSVKRSSGVIEKYEPQFLFSPSGAVNIIQSSTELEADLSATMLIRRT